MKKFVILSVLIALAGIAVGVARRQDTATRATEVAATADTSAPTTAPTDSSTTTTMKPPAKPAAVAAKATTTTTTRPVTVAADPVTTTTAPVQVAPSTTSTTRSKPACTLTAKNAQVAPGGAQVIHLASNMPGASAKVSIVGGTNESGWVTIDPGGAATWQVTSPTQPGVAKVSTTFRFPLTGQTIGSVCSTTYEVG